MDTQEIIVRWLQKIGSELKTGEQMLFPADSRQDQKDKTKLFLKELKTLAKIDPLTASQLQIIRRFEDHRFVYTCDLMTADTCFSAFAPCTNIDVQYDLQMPYVITSSNANSITSNTARWTFSLNEVVDVWAESGSTPPSPTTAAPTATTPTITSPTAITTTACPDSDGDGWDDCYEATMMTNPYQQDSDGDGLIDPLDPNPLVAGTTATPSTTTVTTATSPAPTLVVVMISLGAVIVLLYRRH